MIASPANIVQGTCRISFAHRNKFKRVKARIYDHKKAKQVEIEAESDEEGNRSPTRVRRRTPRRPRRTS